MLLALLTVTALFSSSKFLSTASDPSNVTNQHAISVQSLSSTVFPLHGNVYPIGMYHVAMNIGGNNYFLHIDTGSDLTWIQCEPCRNCWKGPNMRFKPKEDGYVKCRDEMCPWAPGKRDCRIRPNRCDYQIKYVDHLSSEGVLVTEFFSLKLSKNGMAKPKLALGCGCDQRGKSEPSVDGILGLGSGKASIISQLTNQKITKNIFGHCLSRKNGGYLFFGDDIVPSHGVNWASMTRISSGNYYSPGKPSFHYGNKHLDVNVAAPAVFDSGTTFTYFADQPYQKILLELENDLKNKPLKRVFDPDMVCWRGAKPFKSVDDVKKLFRSLVLKFGSGRGEVKLEIPPENFLIVTKHGNACLGILKGSKFEVNLNLIGDISMQDMMVIYDNEKNRIGWAQKDCHKHPKHIFPLP